MEWKVGWKWNGIIRGNACKMEWNQSGSGMEWKWKFHLRDSNW